MAQQFSEKIEKLYQLYSEAVQESVRINWAYRGADVRTIGLKRKETIRARKLYQAIREEGLDLTKTIGSLATRF